MREIKFRAWRKDARIMYPVLGINFGEWGFVDVERQLPPLSLNEIELMQFTGLRDKNGNEIYEGDIVRNSHYGWDTSKAWAVTWDSDGIALSGTHILNTEKHQLEVIGNRFQNPELLK